MAKKTKTRIRNPVRNIAQENYSDLKKEICTGTVPVQLKNVWNDKYSWEDLGEVPVPVVDGSSEYSHIVRMEDSILLAFVLVLQLPE